MPPSLSSAPTTRRHSWWVRCWSSPGSVRWSVCWLPGGWVGGSSPSVCSGWPGRWSALRIPDVPAVGVWLTAAAAALVGIAVLAALLRLSAPGRPGNRPGEAGIHRRRRVGGCFGGAGRRRRAFSRRPGATHAGWAGGCGAAGCGRDGRRAPGPGIVPDPGPLPPGHTQCRVLSDRHRVSPCRGWI